MQLSDFITITDVARTCGLSYHTLYHRVKRHSIPIERMGSVLLVPRKHVKSISYPVRKSKAAK